MKFKKKPVVIKAYQFTLPMSEIAPEWLKAALGNGKVKFVGATTLQSPQLYVYTLEGTMIANEGDWIIQGVKGELYPCKPDIFAATYEAVE